VEEVWAVFFENCFFSEIFEDIGQEKNVRKKIVIVIILERFHVVVSANLFCPIVIFLGEGFIV